MPLARDILGWAATMSGVASGQVAIMLMLLAALVLGFRPLIKASVKNSRARGLPIVNPSLFLITGAAGIAFFVLIAAAGVIWSELQGPSALSNSNDPRVSTLSADVDSLKTTVNGLNKTVSETVNKVTSLGNKVDSRPPAVGVDQVHIIYRLSLINSCLEQLRDAVEAGGDFEQLSKDTLDQTMTPQKYMGPGFNKPRDRFGRLVTALEGINQQCYPDKATSLMVEPPAEIMDRKIQGEPEDNDDARKYRRFSWQSNNVRQSIISLRTSLNQEQKRLSEQLAKLPIP